MPDYIRGPDGQLFLVPDGTDPLHAASKVKALYGPQGNFLGPQSNSLGSWLGTVGGALTQGLGGIERGLGQLRTSLLQQQAQMDQAMPHPFLKPNAAEREQTAQDIKGQPDQRAQAFINSGLWTGQAGQNLMPKNPTGPQQFAGGLLQAAPAMALGFVPDVGPFLAAGAFGAQGAGQMFDTAADLGKQFTPQANAAAEENAGLSGALGLIPGMSGAGRGLAAIAKAGAVGGAAMGGMQLGSNLITKQNLNPNQPVWQGVPQAALTGGILGSGFHALLGGAAKAELARQEAGGDGFIEPARNARGEPLLPNPDTIYVKAEQGQVSPPPRPGQRESVLPPMAPGELIPEGQNPNITQRLPSTGLASVDQLPQRFQDIYHGSEDAEAAGALAPTAPTSGEGSPGLLPQEPAQPIQQTAPIQEAPAEVTTPSLPEVRPIPEAEPIVQAPGTKVQAPADAQTLKQAPAVPPLKAPPASATVGPLVVRAADFKDTGNYNVTHGDLTATMNRETQGGGGTIKGSWYRTDKENPDHSPIYLGDTKAQATIELAKIMEQDAAVPNPHAPEPGVEEVNGPVRPDITANKYASKGVRWMNPADFNVDENHPQTPASDIAQTTGWFHTNGDPGLDQWNGPFETSLDAARMLATHLGITPPDEGGPTQEKLPEQLRAASAQDLLDEQSKVDPKSIYGRKVVAEVARRKGIYKSTGQTWPGDPLPASPAEPPPGYNVLNLGDDQKPKWIATTASGQPVDTNAYQSQAEAVQAANSHAATPAANPVKPPPTNEGQIYLSKGGDQDSSAPISVAMQQQIGRSVQQEMGRVGLHDIGAQVVSRIRGFPDAAGAYYNSGTPIGRLIRLATDVYEPGLTQDQLTQRVLGTLDHETVHAARDLGLFTKSEWNALQIAAEKRGYGEQARTKYPELDGDRQGEEAVAEMYREWAQGRARVVDHPTGLMARLGKFFQGIVRGFGRAKADNIMQKMFEGEIGGRARRSEESVSSGGDVMLSRQSQPEDKNERGISQYGNVERFVTKGGEREKLVRPVETGLMGLQDQQLGLANLAHKGLTMGDRGILRDDPRLIQTGMAGRVQDRMKAYTDKLIKPQEKMAQAVRLTEADVTRLERMLPKDGNFITEMRKAHPELSATQVGMEALNQARHAPERNAYIRDTREATVIDPQTGKEVPMENGSGWWDQDARTVTDKWFPSLSLDKQQAMNRYHDALKAEIASSNAQAIKDGLMVDYPKVRAFAQQELAKRQAIINDPGSSEAQVKQATLEAARFSHMIKLIPDYKNYVPLRGHLGDESETDPYFGQPGGLYSAGLKNLNVRGKEDPYAAGRQSFADDTIGNIHRRGLNLIARGEENKIGNSILRMTERNGGSVPGYISKLPPDPTRPGRQVMPKTPGVDPITGKRRMMPDPHWRDPGSDFFTTKVNGNEIHMEIHDPALKVALKGVPSAPRNILSTPMHWFMNGIRLFSNVVRETAINMNPSWAPVLLFRHTGVAAMYGNRYEPGIWKNIMGGTVAHTYRLLSNDPQARADLKELAGQGGLSGILTTRDVEGQVAHLMNHLNRLTQMEKEGAPLKARMAQALEYSGKVADLLRAVNNHAEWATRVAVYRSFKQRGWAPARAAAIAKELTIDFDRKGTWSSGLGALYVFANATVQDAHALASSLIASGAVRKTVLGLIAAGFAEAPLNQMMGGKDDAGNYNYDNIKESERARAIVLPLPGTNGGFIKIPVLYGPAAFFDVGRQAYKAVTGKESAPTAIGNSMMAFINSFSPIGDTSQGLLHAAAPTIARIPLEIATNTGWNGAKIHPDEQNFGTGKVASQSHFNNTEQPFIDAANAIHVGTGGEGEYIPGKYEFHPDDIQYLYNQMIGGLGQTIEKAATLPGKIMNPNAEKAAGRQFGPQDIPGAGAFALRTSSSGVQANYEDYARPIMANWKNFTAATKSSGAEGMRYLDSHSTQLNAYGIVEEVESDRKASNTQIKAIQADQSLSAEQKQIQIAAERQKQVNLEASALKRLRDIPGLHPESY